MQRHDGGRQQWVTMNWDALEGLSCGNTQINGQKKHHLFRLRSTLREEGIKGHKVRAHVPEICFWFDHGEVQSRDAPRECD